VDGGRPDLVHDVSVVRRVMENPRRVLLETFKWILRYVTRNVSSGLEYKQSTHSGDEI